MTIFLKQSTAADIPLGPFVDSGDGFTPETTLTITQPDIRLKKGAGAWAQKNAAQTLTHEENGWYELALDTTDTGTLGQLMIAVYESGALPVWYECWVLPANAYDALFAGSGVGLRADVQGWLGTAPATPTVNGVPEVDLTHVAGVTTDVSTIPASVAAILVDTATIDTPGEIAAAVWNADATTYQGAGTFGLAIGDPVADGAGGIYKGVVTDAAGLNVAVDVVAVKAETAAILADTTVIGATGEGLTTLATQASVNTIDDFLDTEINAIKVVTDALPNAGALTTIQSDLDNIQTRLPAALTGDGNIKADTLRVGGTLQTAGDLSAQIDTVDNLLDTELPALTTAVDALPTNAELATALGTADDAILAAIAALNNLSAAQVNAEVLDVLNVDTFAQPAQGNPAATTTLSLMIRFLYKAWRNQSTQTATEYALYADDAVTKDHEAVVSDDGTTFTKGEVSTGA